MGRRIRLIVVIAGAAAALTLGIRSWRAGTVPVTAATVHTGPLEVWITTNGVVEPTDPHQLRAPAAAFVRAVNVVEGQAVTKGTVLMTLDFAQQRADLARVSQADLSV